MKHSINYIHQPESDSGSPYLAIEMLIEFKIRSVKEGCGRPVYDVEIGNYEVVEVVAWIGKDGGTVVYCPRFIAAAERLFRDALRDSKSTSEAVEAACVKSYERELSLA